MTRVCRYTFLTKCELKKAEYELKSFSFEVFVSVYNNNLGRKDQHPAILYTRKKINRNKK